MKIAGARNDSYVTNRRIWYSTYVYIYYKNSLLRDDIVAEWSNALRSGRSSFGSAGSNPADVTILFAPPGSHQTQNLTGYPPSRSEIDLDAYTIREVRRKICLLDPVAYKMMNVGHISWKIFGGFFWGRRGAHHLPSITLSVAEGNHRFSPSTGAGSTPEKRARRMPWPPRTTVTGGGRSMRCSS